jgi:hypothetical protein
MSEDQKDVNLLLDVEEGLSDWEVNFAESLNRWLRNNEELTKKQRAKLHSILKEHGL